jgi:hypothetical protein
LTFWYVGFIMSLKGNMAKKLSWFIFITFVLAKLLWNGWSEPLTEVHWDSVVYLYYAKQFADTAFIQHHVQQAAAIAAQVEGHRPREEPFSAAYWRFSRLGHIVLLGVIVTLLGATEEAIIAAHWLYNTLMALTMVCAVLLVRAVIRYLGLPRSQYVVLWAAAGSAGLYMLSDVYDYLGRCLVSEVPALFLLTLASLLLIIGVHRRSRCLSCLSGLCAFGAYSVRVESVWLYMAFCVSLAMTLWPMRRSTPWMRTYVWAGSAACACYLCYAWYFYPLATPALFLLFAQYQPPWGSTTPMTITMGAAGGLLWIGSVAGMVAVGPWAAAHMALAWFGVALLPTVPYLIAHSLHMVPLQVRMLTCTVVLPLLLASTVGWAYFGEAKTPHQRYGLCTVTLLTVVLIAIAMTPVGARLQGRSDLGMLHHLGAWLRVPLVERYTYPFREMHRISHTIYRHPPPVVLVYDSGDEDLSLIRFFGPPYPPQANLTMLPVNHTVPCADSLSASQNLENVSACVGITADTLQQFTAQGITVFFLTSKEDIVLPFHYTEVLRTQNYHVGIITP